MDSTINRRSSLSDNSGTLESYSYLGLGTVVKRAHPQPNVDLTYITAGGSGDGAWQREAPKYLKKPFVRPQYNQCVLQQLQEAGRPLSVLGYCIDSILSSMWTVRLMGKKRALDAKLARLGSLRKEPISPTSAAELRKFLADVSNFVVAEAAAIVGNANLAKLSPDLVAAFDRFMIDAEESDKQCRAKIAVVEALNKLDHDEPDVFLRGIRHVQHEPVWGGTQDTAAVLRGDCAFALVRLNHRDAIALLVDMFVDPEKVARVAAVQAMEGVASVAAVPLLRLKARVGDEEPEVTCECLAALLRREPDAVPFVAGFLHGGDQPIQEGAALALGETRRPGAFEVLRDCAADMSSGSLQEAVLLGIAMLRLPAAIDYLVGLIPEVHTSRAAVAALAIHRHNEQIRERVAAAVAGLKDADLTAWFQKRFSRSA